MLCDPIVRCAAPLALVGAVMLSCPTARGADRAVTDKHTNAYWITHSSITAGSLIVAAAATKINAPETEWLRPGDACVAGTYSSTADNVSDALIGFELLAPLPPLGFASNNEEFLNASLIYAEVLSINLAANQVVKYWVRRPRPYTYSADRKARACYETDDCLSFYSGHSSTAFAAAFSSAYLFSEVTTANTAVKAGFWGMQYTLASAVANLEVRAGRHFYSDVVVGGLVGTAIGVLVPTVAHRGRAAPSTSEILAGVAGIPTGVLLTSFVPRTESTYYRDMALAPLPVVGGMGLSLQGIW